MIQGIDVNQRIEFVSENDKVEPKTIFVFRPLSGFEMLEIEDGEKGNLKIRKFLNETICEIKGIENKESFINSLPIAILGELIKKANEINSFSEIETKN